MLILFTDILYSYRNWTRGARGGCGGGGGVGLIKAAVSGAQEKAGFTDSSEVSYAEE